jgi:hypothetical protein
MNRLNRKNVKLDSNEEKTTNKTKIDRGNFSKHIVLSFIFGKKKNSLQRLK